MAEYLVRTDKSVRLDEILHLHGIHHFSVQRLEKHGDLIDRGLVQEVLAQLLPLVITNELTDKEIGLVHRTVGAIAEMINEQEVVVEATE